MNRLLLKPLWFSSIYDSGTPKYLYFDEETEHFEVGCMSEARQHTWEFIDEDVEQMQKDYDLSLFMVLDEGRKR